MYITDFYVLSRKGVLFMDKKKSLKIAVAMLLANATLLGMASAQQTNTLGIPNTVNIIGTTQGNTYVNSTGVIAGTFNSTLNQASEAMLLGGINNQISDAIGASILGGTENNISGASNYSSIIGGEDNKLVGNYSAIVGGFGAVVNGEHNIAIGKYAKADGATSSVAIGDSASVVGFASTAIGHNSKVQGFNALALAGGNVTIDEGIAIGFGATTGIGKSVAIGAGAVTSNVDHDAMNYKLGTKDLTFASKDANHPISFGSNTETRTLQNVSAGKLSDTSTDAINGSQLHKVAVTPITFAGDSGNDIDKTLGTKLEIKGGAINVADGNIGVISDGQALHIKLSKDLSHITSIHAEAGSIDFNNAKLSNLAPGAEDSNDAATMKQLKSVKDIANTANANAGDAINKITNAINKADTAIAKADANENALNDKANKDGSNIDPDAWKNKLGIKPADTQAIMKLEETMHSEIGQVGAHSAALAALKPLQYNPMEKIQVMAGVGRYKAKNAVALGVAMHPNENLLFYGGISMAKHSTMMANAGMTWRVGTSEQYDATSILKDGPITAMYRIAKELDNVKHSHVELREDVDAIKMENQQLQIENKELRKSVKTLTDEMEVVKKELAELRAQKA